jgi:two-component system, cell cycle response regulator
MPAAPRPRPQARSAPLALAHRAWRLLHLDATRSIELAESACLRAAAAHDAPALAWAHLVRGFHRIYFASLADAERDLAAARTHFASLGDRAGEILATAGIARVTWRSGRVQEALAMLLPLRDEGLALLKHEQRGLLLNAIAGCYSAQSRSEEAFAYMYEALRSAGPRRANGFDTVLHCNLSHELMQLGDYDEALAQIERGLDRCEGLKNAKLLSVLLINRVLCLVDMQRADEALPTVHELLSMQVGPLGRGSTSLHFETLALAAVRAGQTVLAEELCQRARQTGMRLADEQVELAVAEALVALARKRPEAGLLALRAVAELVDGAGDDAASLRVRCLHAQVASEVHEARGDAQAALCSMRLWQRLHALRSRHASRARYQAATLQTELLTLKHRLEEKEAERRATERSRAALAAANEALSRKVAEVQSLQAALQEQATHDALTGLANRRHLNDTLPPLLARALRERQPLAAVLIDLDRFKAVNDSHGHDVGDHLLAAFGRLLREGLRASDQAFRYGGEEFCLLMPGTRAVDAAHKVEALLARWREQVFVLDAVTLHEQSFSAGVADTSEGPVAPAVLLKTADARLLLAKRAGRARVVPAPSEPSHDEATMA